MTTPIIITLVLLLVALILFATEKLPVDIVSLILIIGLVLTKTLTVTEAVAGFGNDIIITIAGLFILTGGLVKTGIVDVIGRRLHRIAGENEFLLTALVMLVAAVCASVMKNTTTTAMLVPVVMGLAERARIPPSKLLMPLAFGAILGGSCTLIGTSTNLAVSGALQRYQAQPEFQGLQMQPFTMFELTTVGVAIVGVGMLYMLLMGIWLLPKRGGSDSLTEQYKMREYVTEVVVLPRSRLIGKTLGEARLGQDLELTVVGILRDNEQLIAPSPYEKIGAHDLLLVQGGMSDILRIKTEAGIEIKADFMLSDRLLEAGEVELFEVMIIGGSRFIGRTLKTLRFRQRYELTVLAINRHGTTFSQKISSVPLRFGDVLLVQGKRELVDPLVADGYMLMLEDVSARGERTEKRGWALLAFAAFLILSLSKYIVGIDFPLAIAVLIGVMILLASRAVRTQEMYTLIEWRLLVLIGCMISFGTAMEKSGADIFLANFIETYAGQYGGMAVLAGFFVLTVALTQPMSNQAAALVVLPVAVKTALALGLNPRTFAVVVTYAASCSFITPLEPACILVYTPGRYRFFDFVKVGTVLTIAVFIIVMWLVPIWWPLK